MYPRVAYVTSESDSDREPALAAFERAHLQGIAVHWDDSVAWDDFDLVLVRAGDAGRRADFLRWARHVEEQTLLANPARVLARNSDRTYLLDLARRGVPTVETVWFEPGDDPDSLSQALVAAQWPEFVVMPNIRGGLEPIEFRDPADAARQAARIASRGWVAMVQPAAGAQLSVVVLGGTISHADSQIPEEVVELLPSVTAAHGEELLQARIDLVERGGSWALADLNATDPQLSLDAAAADRLARAVRTVLSPPVEV